jgi:hypothetical protein
MENIDKTLFDLFDYNWKINQPIKPLLFHYTGINALKNILEHNELWASKSDFLNDYSEIAYIHKILTRRYLVFLI